MSYRTPLEQRIAKKATQAIVEHNLIEDGDRVMVGLSGGKDRWALIQILDVLRKRAPITFSICAINVNSMIKAIGNVAPRHLLDTRLHPVAQAAAALR